MNNKDNTWNDPNWIKTIRHNYQPIVIGKKFIKKKNKFYNCRNRKILTSNQWKYLIYQLVGSIEDYQGYNG